MSDLRLAVERDGEGVPVVLLHGLTATRRYVVMGSHALQRSGHCAIAYDARGHGDSPPAPRPDAYRYEDLAGDLLAVLDDTGLERAVLAGASMGAHTAVAFALRRPERVAGLVLITPAYDPETHGDPRSLDRWDALARGLRERGVDGFMAAYGEPPVPERWRDTVLAVTRQRLERHRHPEALADALEAVPRSRPFEELAELRALRLPVAVVASRDEADPGHPLAVGEAYAAAIRGARLETEEPGRSPLAWQGARVSAVIAEVAAAAGEGGLLRPADPPERAS
jgi:pimeloyl-ACP methyl ester carboxylesterase